MTQFIEKLKDKFPNLEIKREEPMSKHTTFRIGGPAELFVSPKAVEVV